MGLEAATYVQDLDASNPLAGDKKNVGDDHLRLIKTTLKNSFPNLTQAFRIPEFLSKTGNYSVVEADDNKTILCDTSGGAFTLTLPTPANDGWLVRVIKGTAGANPVYVAPPSGNISTSVGSVAKVRCDVPFSVTTFMWTGSAFVKVDGSDDLPGSFKPLGAATTPRGFALATGQSLVRADHPELFLVWSTSFGAVDGTHFNAPDLRDRFIVGSGSTYALAATGGEATHTLTEAEIPTHNHGDDTPDHLHQITTGTNTANSPGNATFLAPGTGTNFNTGGANTRHQHANFGGGGAHENRPPYYALAYAFRLC